MSCKITGWTRENLAWLAGLVEGEGCFQYSKSRCLSLVIAMTDEDVLRKARAISGMGHVYGPTRPGGVRKAYWRWAVNRQADTYALMIALYPWLGSRRQAAVRDVVYRWLDWQRNKPPRPVNRGNQKLTPEAIAEIRAAFGAGPAFQHGVRKSLAEKFNVNSTTVTRVAQNRSART